MSNLAEIRLVELDEPELQSIASQSSSLSDAFSDLLHLTFESKPELPIETKSEPPIESILQPPIQNKPKPSIEKNSGLLIERGSDAGVSNAPNESKLNLDDSADPVLVPTPTFAEIHRRATRQARGKSFIIGCYIFFDLMYCIPRFVLLFPGLKFNPVYWKPFAILCTVGRSNDSAIYIDWTKAWIGVLSWTNYLIANVLLSIAVISLNLKFCYAFITLKTGSAILLFLGLIVYGHDCHAETILYDTFIFLLFHLPLQILGVKLCEALIRSIRRALKGRMAATATATRRNVNSIGGSESSLLQTQASSSSPPIQSRKNIRAPTGYGGGKLWYTT